MARPIAAISTPVGNGAIGIVRLSGDDVLAVIDGMFTPFNGLSIHKLQPNKLYLGTFHSETICDKCLFVYFAAPHSYSGEDMCEIQCHGGIRVVEGILSSLLNAGATLADKGEFTKRALINGKFSLTEAEGIIDMINAETVSQANSAYRLSSGELATTIRSIIETLTNAICSLEVGLDNPSEYEEDAVTATKPLISSALDSIVRLLSHTEAARLIRRGVRIGLIGKTNSGKSSLLNAILGRERAIVTPIEGTTRDTLEESIEYKGYKLTFVDTAGIRESQDEIEKQGIIRSVDVARSADVVIAVIDNERGIDNEQKAILTSYPKKPLIVAFNKNDIVEPTTDDFAQINELGVTGVSISAKNNANIHLLLDEVVRLSKVNSIDISSDFVLNERHIEELKIAKEYLEDVASNLGKTDIDCLLLDMQLALCQLSELSGDAVSDDIVDSVFSRYCVGK